jgi:sigma-B regulation protein RsbU (phosphoserine phosphatase)
LRRFSASFLLDRIRGCFEPNRHSPITDPLHSCVPALRDAEMAAIYYGRRRAGDFYEFLRVGPSRVLFGLFDVAGRREETRGVLIAAQATFRTDASHLFAHDCNEAIAMIELSQRINRTILQFEGGVRSCPAFLGCYNEDLGTVCFANAGHTPGLIGDASGIMRLEATGLPLGLFSHTTRSASTCALMPGAALLLVSRGVVETEYDNEEFGLDHVTAAFRNAAAANASDICLPILQAVQRFLHAAPPTTT